MISRSARLGLLSCSLLSACATERVVLLPSPGGRPSAIVWRDATGETVLDKPYAARLRLAGTEGLGYVSSPEDVQRHFGAALSAQPALPSSYLLYFETGGEVLTADSNAEFEKIKAEIVQRVAAEVTVVGHTDRVGSRESNDALSLKRAEAVRNLLIKDGIPADRIEMVGRGERDLLVPTDPGVDEPRNRRVEINLR